MAEQNSTNTPDYKVGYGRTPMATRFRPGQSGNPKGRPKGSKNLKTDLTEELGEPITVREGDRVQKVSKQRAVIKMLMTRTLKGDTRAANLLLGMMSRVLDKEEGDFETAEPLRGDELEILETFMRRSDRKVQGDAPPAAEKCEEAPA